MADPSTQEMATRLHAAAIKLLRLLRREDDASGMTAPRMSALSVLVFRGPLSLAEMAAAEQVRAPTMSRLVEGLVRDGLVLRETVPTNRRMVRISATEAGRRLLEEGRERRVRALVERLMALAPSERRALARGVEVLERVTR
jgi:DNA-binding MarR family transcriptional regulator